MAPSATMPANGGPLEGGGAAAAARTTAGEADVGAAAVGDGDVDGSGVFVCSEVGPVP